MDILQAKTVFVCDSNLHYSTLDDGNSRQKPSFKHCVFIFDDFFSSFQEMVHFFISYTQIFENCLFVKKKSIFFFNFDTMSFIWFLISWDWANWCSLTCMCIILDFFISFIMHTVITHANVHWTTHQTLIRYLSNCFCLVIVFSSCLFIIHFAFYCHQLQSCGG